MRLGVFFLVASTCAALSTGCAQTSPCPQGQALVDGNCTPVDPYPSKTKTISMGCVQPVIVGSNVACCINWELTVDPRPIVGGEGFAAEFEGKVVFAESQLALAERFVLGGFRLVNVVELQATVHVRGGATGDDVILRPEPPIPYTCAVSRTPCQPAHDLEGVLHRRGNTDCQPEGNTNPCGKFGELATSDDCTPDGFCASL